MAMTSDSDVECDYDWRTMAMAMVFGALVNGAQWHDVACSSYWRPVAMVACHVSPRGVRFRNYSDEHSSNCRQFSVVS